MLSELKVAFLTLRDSYISGGKCFHDTSNGRFVNLLAQHFRFFTFVTYVDREESASYDCEIIAKKVKLIPFKNTFYSGIRHGLMVRRMLKQIEQEHDVLIIQFPYKTFFAPLVLKKPVVVQVCSNLLTAASNPAKYRGFKKKVSLGYASLLNHYAKAFFSKSNVSVITNGSELAKLYASFHPIPIVSSSIFEREIVNQAQLRVRGKKFNVLFVGRPSLEKGFDTLMDALTRCMIRVDIIVTCVGFSKEEFVKLYTKSFSEIENRIEFKGKLSFSEALFDVYRLADVLVLPSRSEGTPRVLVEARAMGCPVIATNVGGIPDSIEDGEDGLMFEAGRADQLAALIMDLCDDEEKRRKLIVNGLRRVHEMTLEKQVKVFENKINQIFVDEK